jgi:hypothetical protein
MPHQPIVVWLLFYELYIALTFVDTKGVISIRNSKNRQSNDQTKRDKKILVDKILHRKLKIELHEPQKYSVTINQVMVATIMVLLNMICTMIGLINILLFKHVRFSSESGDILHTHSLTADSVGRGGRNRSM